MTVIVGFIPPRGDSVVLWADSAVTHNRPTAVLSSSFGEVTRHENGLITEEGVVKIKRLSSNAAATWAGDAHAGYEFATWIMANMTSQRPLRSILEDALTAATWSGEFVCLVARYLNGPELCRLSSSTKTVEDVGIASEGSLNEEMRLTIHASLESGIFQGWSNEQLLAGLQALFLVRACNQSPYDDYVGGATFGAIVQGGGVNWSPDTGWFVLPLDEGATPSHGFVFMRHGIGVVSSTLLGPAARFFPMYRSQEEVAKWNAEGCGDEVLQTMNGFVARYFIVTKLGHGRAWVIDMEAPDPPLTISDQIMVQGWLDDALGEPTVAQYGIAMWPATQHGGQSLLNKVSTTVDDARLLAEYLVLARQRGMDPAVRKSEVERLLAAFPDDQWLSFVLATEDEGTG